MGKASRTAGSEMTETGNDQATQADSGAAAKSPEEVRSDIEQTREELGDTVEALAAKTDVKAQAQTRLASAKQEIADSVAQVKETVAGKKDDFTEKAKQASPESATAGAQQLGVTVRERPLPFAAAGAFCLGLAIGWLLRR
jgi:ElaB/YqjD/DUF883 family membrane-anchored ribosome-binding protein